MDFLWSYDYLDAIVIIFLSYDLKDGSVLVQQKVSKLLQWQLQNLLSSL